MGIWIESFPSKLPVKIWVLESIRAPIIPAPVITPEELVILNEPINEFCPE